MKSAASKLESRPAIIPPWRGQERTLRTPFRHSSVSSLSSCPCESLRSSAVGPLSPAPLASPGDDWYMKSRERTYTAQPRLTVAPQPHPAPPTILTEMQLLSF